MTTISTDRLEWLRHQLSRGWRVEGPVIERAMFYWVPHPTSAFEFVLRHEDGCQVVAVPDCPALRSFIRERALLVVTL
ncbi:MAG TPA: hypothetical protein VFT66_20540 [Roseiflexaceae bacterium]|jgi:hypothetical protein|nr:hypothetical protein [Roseiflexaceae bacterium]